MLFRSCKAIEDKEGTLNSCFPFFYFESCFKNENDQVYLEKQHHYRQSQELKKSLNSKRIAEMKSREAKARKKALKEKEKEK